MQFYKVVSFRGEEEDYIVFLGEAGQDLDKLEEQYKANSVTTSFDGFIEWLIGNQFFEVKMSNYFYKGNRR